MSEPVGNSTKVADSIHAIVVIDDESNPEQVDKNTAAEELLLIPLNQSTDSLQGKIVNNEKIDIESENNSENVIGAHIGIECVGCKMMPIKGKRFMCQTCGMDCNYCEDCKVEGKRPWPCRSEHKLVCIYMYTTGKNYFLRV